jgi:ankyrin repeat protein
MYDLLKACREGDINKVRNLLSEGADPNSEDALWWSCFYNHTEVIKLLLEFGANPCYQSALFWCSHHNNIELVKIILDKGADPNEHGILKHAWIRNSLEAVKILLEYGADPFLIEDKKDKIDFFDTIIKHELITEEWIKENFNKISPEVWEKIYE